MKKIFLVLFLFLSFFNISYAKDFKRLPPIIKYIESNGISVVDLGKIGGWRGFLLQTSAGQQSICYMGEDEKYCVDGLLYDANGVNVTQYQINALANKIAQYKKSGTSYPIYKASNFKYNSFIDLLKSNKDEILKLTPDEGKTLGFDMTKKQYDMTFYVQEKNSKYAVLGNLINNLGTGLTMIQVTNSSKLFKPKFLNKTSENKSTQNNTQNHKIDYSKYLVKTNVAEKISILKSTANFSLTTSNKNFYAFVDPNCPYCHESWSLLGSYIRENKINPKVVLVDFEPNSKIKDLGLLGSKNPGVLFLQGEGSVADVSVIKPPTNKVDYDNAGKLLKINLYAASKLGVTETPTFFYIDRNKLYKFTGVSTVGILLNIIKK